MTNSMAIIMALAEFQRIHEEEGEDAAIAWAEQMALDITPEESESSDNSPNLRIVS